MHLVVGAFAAIVLAATASGGSQGTSLRVTDETQAALYEGNRLFRDGQIEAAVAAYLEGTSQQAPHPTLLYNLGTALHHLDRWPEAILWYRRAALARAAYHPRAEDPWLEDNLWLARRSLGSQVVQIGGLLGWLVRHTGDLRSAAIAIAWITLVVVVIRDKMPAWVVVAAAGLAISVYGGAAAVERWGPRPAVILQDCLTPAGELPAGTEVWVRPGTGGWRIPGSTGNICPPATVELVFP